MQKAFDRVWTDGFIIYQRTKTSTLLTTPNALFRSRKTATTVFPCSIAFFQFDITSCIAVLQLCLPINPCYFIVINTFFKKKKSNSWFLTTDSRTLPIVGNILICLNFSHLFVFCIFLMGTTVAIFSLLYTIPFPPAMTC